MVVTPFELTDSSGHCVNGSDFTCRNRHCISPSLECDGHDNCGDNSDEQYQRCTPIKTTQQTTIYSETTTALINTTATATNTSNTYTFDDKGFSRWTVITIIGGVFVFISFSSILLLRFSCVRRILFNEHFRILPAPNNRRKVPNLADDIEIKEIS